MFSLKFKWLKRKDKKKTKTQDQPVNNNSKLLETPWRKLEHKAAWTEEFAEKILGDIQKHVVDERNVSNIRILLLGSVGAGKSSFMNTVASIDAGRIAQVTSAGGADGSLTFAMKEYGPSGKLKNFRLIDTMGVEDNDQGGLNLKDVLYLVKGHIAPGYKFNPATSIDEKSSEFRREPEDKNKIHCVVFVIDANVAGNDNISDARRRKIREVSKELKEIDISRIVLITKIDALCGLVEEDIANTYKSEKVKQAVHVVKELYSVPEQNIFPVQNYENETEADHIQELLPLLALRQMIRFGSDFLKNSISAQTCEEKQ